MHLAASDFSSVDRANMLGLTVGYADQFRAGRALAQQVPLPPCHPERVVLLGTGGGSAASGHLLQGYLYDRLRVPLWVAQGYHAPAFVDDRTLVLAVSYSGNTEETLQAVAEAHARGATLVVVSAGGRLGEMAAREGLAWLKIPGGIPPRAALGYVFVPLLTVLERYGMVPDASAELAETVALLEHLSQEWGPASPPESNEAKRVASLLHGCIPVVYGALELTAPAARRWKNQFGENAKYMAMWNAVPQVHHDEAVGWEMSPELLRHLAVVLLRDTVEEEKIARRFDATAAMLEGRAGRVVQVRARGRSPLARLMSLVYLGDFVSCYLAVLGDVDPTPVPVIDRFKELMGQ